MTLICPVCKSEQIQLESGGVTGKYICQKCKYIGSLVLEKED